VYRGIFATLISALAVAVVAAGCGSSDDDSLTKAEFTQQADAICKQGSEASQKEYVALLKDRVGEKNMTLEAGLTQGGEEVLIPFYKTRAEELGELSPPSADEAQVAAIIEALEEGIEEGEENPDSIPAGTPAIGRSSKLAAAYGLEECGP